MQALFLTMQQIRDAVEALEGVAVARRTLVEWLAQGLVRPSVRWDRKRGRYHPALFNLDDLARLRLVVRLRRRAFFTSAQVKAVLRALEREHPDVLKARTDAVLLVVGTRVIVQRGDGAEQVQVPHNQLMLSFRAAELLKGNRETAERITRAA